MKRPKAAVCKCVACKGKTVQFSRARTVKNMNELAERGIVKREFVLESILKFDDFHAAFSVGDAVRYHPIIGEDHDGKVYTIRLVQFLDDHRQVAFLNEKSGYVAIEAVSMWVDHCRDEDCRVVDGECVICHVLHTAEPCSKCGGRAFHKELCPTPEGVSCC
jgi:hypothetical protein